MIEGLRLLPWLQQETRTNPAGVQHLNDCGACMRERSPQMRQEMRCGYEPAIDPRLSSTWSPNGFSGFDENPGHIASTCPGYTTALPEVREVSWLHFWFAKGQLHDKLGGEPSEVAQALIETLAAETSAVESHEMAKARDAAKGGR